MSSYRKTWSERILNAASKENFVDNRTLRTRLRVPTYSNVGEGMDTYQFDNSIGRTVRSLASEKKLKRVARGTYQITKKGEKALFA